MRQYRSVKPESLPEPTASDFLPRIRRMITDIDYWAQDAAFGFNRIILGQSPDGSGASLTSDHGSLTGLLDDDHPQYFLLGGRAGSQAAYGGTTSTGTLSLNSNSSGGTGSARIQLTANPSIIFDIDHATSTVDTLELSLGAVSSTLTGRSLTLSLTSTGGNSSSMSVSNVSGGATTVLYKGIGHASQTGNYLDLQTSAADNRFKVSATAIATVGDFSAQGGSIFLEPIGGGTGYPRIRGQGTNNSMMLTTNQSAASAFGVINVMTGSDKTGPVLVVNGAQTQTARLQEWNTYLNVNLSYISNLGAFVGPITPTSASVTDNVFSILDDVTPTKIAQFQCANLAAGTNTFTFPATTAGTFAMINLAQTFTRGQTIQPSVDEAHFVINESGAGATGSLIEINAPSSAGGPVFRVSAGSGSPFYTEMAGGWEVWPVTAIGDVGGFKITFKNSLDAITANREVQWPNANGTVLVRAAGPVNVAPRATLTSGIATAATPGLYQINGYLYCTVTGTATVGLTVTFTDTVPKTVSVASLILGSTTQTQSGVIDVYVTSASNITYSISYTGGGTGTYGARIRATKLG